MTSFPLAAPLQGPLQRVADALAALPRWLQITTMVLGFIVFWPVGLAVLALMLWSRSMPFCRKSSSKSSMRALMVAPPSGNLAFDEYRRETIRRLEEESRDFQGFVERLQRAKDQAEFEAFMAERGARQTNA